VNTPKVKTHATPNPTSLESSRTDLVLDAMRLAERAHRQRNHFRKAPEGEDRPAYFLHLAEVAWMAEEAGLDPEIVAAGFLHDIIEDCGYTRERLAGEIGSARVAELVEWVSEPDRDHSWETRNDAYLKRMQGAPTEVLALSCADKTSNLRDMNRLLVKGHATDSFTSKNHATQRAKVEALDQLYRGAVPRPLYARFEAALVEFRDHEEAMEP
jgi:(p)ppGpp synthase/HD superfamily hydrolase